MIPIVGETDSEGPGINPTIPNFVPPHTFAEEVQTVLNSFAFSDIALSVDGKPVTNSSQYVLVWKKMPDGSWKIAADTSANAK